MKLKNIKHKCTLLCSDFFLKESMGCCLQSRSECRRRIQTCNLYYLEFWNKNLYWTILTFFYIDWLLSFISAFHPSSSFNLSLSVFLIHLPLKMVNLMHVEKAWDLLCICSSQTGFSQLCNWPAVNPCLSFQLLSMEGKWLLRLPVPQIGLRSVCLCVMCTPRKKNYVTPKIGT